VYFVFSALAVVRAVVERLTERAVQRQARLSVAALFLLAGCVNSGSALHAEGPSRVPAAVTPGASGTWRVIPQAPITSEGGSAAAWTGRQLVVWGGQAGDGDDTARVGAAYDPAADRWDVLPAAPVAARSGTRAVWTGREVLFWGGSTGPGTLLADGAAYDPAGRRWRALPAAPIAARSEHQVVWTGREMIVWGGITACCPVDSEVHDRAAAAYDPATNQWRRLPDVPFPWSGDDGDAVTLADGDRPLVWRRGHLGAFDETAGVWHDVAGVQPAPPPGDPGLPSSTADPVAMATVADGDVFTWTGRSGQLHGLAWRPADGTWRRTATLEAQSGGAIVTGGPGSIFAAVGQSARVLEYRIADDRWSELPLAPINTRSAAVLVWTGSGLLVWGGAGDEGPEMDGAIWHCC
jgi:hypothetical protein